MSAVNMVQSFVDALSMEHRSGIPMSVSADIVDDIVMLTVENVNESTLSSVMKVIDGRSWSSGSHILGVRFR